MTFKHLREIAQGATPGPWTIRDGYCYQIGDEFDDALWTANPVHHDAKFIATFSPDTVLLMLDALEAAEAFSNVEELKPGGYEADDAFNRMWRALKALRKHVAKEAET